MFCPNLRMRDLEREREKEHLKLSKLSYDVQNYVWVIILYDRVINNKTVQGMCTN